MFRRKQYVQNPWRNIIMLSYFLHYNTWAELLTPDNMEYLSSTIVVCLWYRRTFSPFDTPSLSTTFLKVVFCKRVCIRDMVKLKTDWNVSALVTMAKEKNTKRHPRTLNPTLWINDWRNTKRQWWSRWKPCDNYQNLTLSKF